MAAGPCRVEDTGHLPRRLSEVKVRTLAGTSASLNPNVTCSGCPQTDTRVPVNNTEETPWDALGLLARSDANDIAKCPPSRFAHCHLSFLSFPQRTACAVAVNPDC